MNVFLRDGREVPWVPGWPVPSNGQTVTLDDEKWIVDAVEFEAYGSRVVLDVSEPLSEVPWSKGTIHGALPQPIRLFFVAVLAVMIALVIWKVFA